MWCQECLSIDGQHLAGCRLDPARPRTVSRRSFLRTAGVLGSAILVAPSLLEGIGYNRGLNSLVFSIDYPYQFVTYSRGFSISKTDLQKTWRKIQGELRVAAAFKYPEWEMLTEGPRRLLA